jgi:CheY-like chemotaxis protein
MEPIICFLVDDDADDQVFFDIAWKKVDKSVQCQFADDGISALKRINNNFSFIPNVVFIDINMPIMNGIRLLKEIKKIERLSGVPVYMYSTASEQRIVDECLQLGATGFIQKQADIKDLLASLHTILDDVRKRIR